MTESAPGGVTTARVWVRPPREGDRARFIELFGDRDFMAYASDPLNEAAASERFDHMVAVCAAVPFGKQPVVERSTGIIMGYTGVDYIDVGGRTWLEWGYRLAPESRGRGYATEAGQALLATAGRSYTGEILAIIDPGNLASQNVCRKLGFTFWRQDTVDGYLCNLYLISV